jgi:hypothetical protein
LTRLCPVIEAIEETTSVSLFQGHELMGDLTEYLR